MTNNAFTMPVFLSIYRRPEATSSVINSLRTVRAPILYIAADGPRENAPGEADRCEAARKTATSVDWPCEVHTLFHDANLGCAGNTTSGLNWFFENVSEGVILEDDLVPDATYFRFCQELLALYRDQPGIMHIAGNSHQYGRRRGHASYYFSKYANFWGWATWRRAWQLYDPRLHPYWEAGDAWSSRWQLSIERANGIAIVPNINLVKNIGFGPEATHTKGMERGAFVEAAAMPFPLVHPSTSKVDRAADVFTYYAHHRMVQHLELIWMYQLMDYIYFTLKPVKRWLLKLWKSCFAA